MFNLKQNQIPTGGKTNVVKPAIYLSMLLLVVWVFIMAQSQGTESSQPVSVEQQARIDSLRLALGKDIQPIREADEPDILGKAFPVFLVMVAVIGGIWFWNRKRGGEGKKKTPSLFEIIAEQDLGPGQSIKIVTYKNHVWVLGVTSTGISLIKELPPDELDRNLHIEKSEVQNPNNFARLLETFQAK